MEMSPTNECIAHPFSGLRLQASRLTYVTPAQTPQSPLSDGSNGRVRVIRDDKLASLFVSGCVVYELDAKPGANLHVMDEFEVAGVCKSHTIKPSMDALPGVIVEPLAEDVGEAEDPESSGATSQEVCRLRTLGCFTRPHRWQMKHLRRSLILARPRGAR